MEGNAARFIRALREHDYYPSIDPPTFEREGDRLGIARPDGVGGRFLPRSRELQVGKGDDAIPSWVLGVEQIRRLGVGKQELVQPAV